MSTDKRFSIIDLPSLGWPTALHLPSRRFRLFVAANLTSVAAETLAEFAYSALISGMIYLCAWGPDCERLHDAVDGFVVADDIGKRLFVGPSEQDTIMSTWHERETLDEALDFFIKWSLPTKGLEIGSNYWLAMSTGNPEWVATIQQRLAENLK